MKVALTHPWCWPWVQRGGERLFADLAQYLAGAGHTVTTVSAAPRGRRSTDGNLTHVVHRAPPLGALRRFDVDQAVAYLPQAAWSLRRSRPDVVHCMYHLDGVAARLAGARPYVVHIQGVPRRSAAVGRPVHRRLLSRSVAGASAVIAVSQAAANALSEEFHIQARVLYNGVYLERFATADVARSERPMVLFPGAVDDPRKRLDVLIAALPYLESRWPDLVVGVADRAAPAAGTRFGERIRYLDVASPDDMPRAYGQAWVTCLPAVEEAFGLALIESLAAGRPAVGVADGGVPEVLREPAWLARPDDPESLAGALDNALAAAEENGTADRCRALAHPFDWSERGPHFEALYRELSSGTALVA